MDEFKEYPSYNALDRVAMFMGVPLLPAIALLIVALLIFVLGGNLFGISGFLGGFVVFPVFLFLRQLSETDDKALNILYLEMIFRAKRVAFYEFGNTLTFAPERYLRDEAVIFENFKVIGSDS